MTNGWNFFFKPPALQHSNTVSLSLLFSHHSTFLPGMLRFCFATCYKKFGFIIIVDHFQFIFVYQSSQIVFPLFHTDLSLTLLLSPERARLAKPFLFFSFSLHPCDAEKCFISKLFDNCLVP